MKSFFTWLVLQCVFARILFGIAVELWRSLHLVGSDSIAYFILPVVVICLCETLVSGVILYDLVLSPIRKKHEIDVMQLRISNPNVRF